MDRLSRVIENKILELNKSALEEQLPDRPAFKEQLPDSCPPSDAVHPEPQNVLRFVKTDNPTEDDFLSFGTLNNLSDESFYTGCLCEQYSCSVYSAPNRLKKLPRIKETYKYIYEFKIDSSSGLIDKKKPGRSRHHIHLWPFKTFSPLNNKIAIHVTERYNP